VSARLPAVRPRQLVRVLERKGWTLARTRGSHLVFAHPETPKLVTVPNHPGDLKRPLLAGILKDAGISREEFVRLL
jgi:predicted RNA binding protein YcfA (HicA-like mRNA interferase family)